MEEIIRNVCVVLTLFHSNTEIIKMRKSYYKKYFLEQEKRP